MRRHAEGLIILSGSAPGRGWRHPVPVVDVLRGAIAEVEDYTRVKVITQSADAVAGAAVADVIHLLAELIENATTYSPASTPVTVRADRVANGFVVEIEDRGVGISSDALARVNDRLANPPEFDPAESDRLGLFVVARLAAKRRIKIVLRPSPYGGIAAIVLLPHDIVVTREALDASADGESRTVLPMAAAAPRMAVAGPGFAQSTGPAIGLLSAGFSPEHRAGANVGGAVTPLADAGSAREATQPEGLDTVPADTESGLPRRVRQASLAPQLKNGGRPQAGAATQPHAPQGRTPAERRALIDSLQHGWLRARSETDPVDDPWTPASSPEQAARPEDREGM